jgi:uncharacterized protein YbjT (DUF2867 family)
MILVAGATGQLGGRIAHALLAAGRPVRVLVRPTSDYASLDEAGASPVIGDLKDRRSLDAAVTGITTVVTTANSAQRGGDDNPRTVDLEGNANLIDAAERAGVRRFVFVSGLGSTLDSPDPFMAAKAATEARLHASSLDFTIVASTPFIDVWVGMVVLGPILDGREVVYVGDGHNRHPMIAMEDAAAFILAAVDNPAASRSYIPIAGPAPFSWQDAIAAFERALGRPVPHRGIAPGERVPGLPDTVQGLVTFLGTSSSELDVAGTAERFGVHLTRMEDWVGRTAEATGMARAQAGPRRA